MLSSDLFTGKLFDSILGPDRSSSARTPKQISEQQRANSHIPQRHHANGLPNAQPDARRHAAIQAFDAVISVDVAECLANGQVLGAIGVVGLALHLDADDLDGLVPGAEAAAEAGRHHLLEPAELLAVVLAGDAADGRLGEARQAEARAPVGGLADGDGVDAAIDAAQALAPVDVHEGGEGARRLDARGRQLVLRDLHRLHAGAEAHGRVRLRHSAHHPARDAAHEIRCA